MGFSLREILHFSKEMSSKSVNHSKIQQKLQAKIKHIDLQIISLKKAKKLIQNKIDLCREVERKEKFEDKSS